MPTTSLATMALCQDDELAEFGRLVALGDVRPTPSRIRLPSSSVAHSARCSVALSCIPETMSDAVETSELSMFISLGNS